MNGLCKESFTMASPMTNSPVALAKEALKVAEAALAAYSHPNSPKTLTQPQLFAILALRQFFKTDYRGGVQMLHDSSRTFAKPWI